MSNETRQEIIFKIKFKSNKLMAHGLIFFSILTDTMQCGFRQTLVSLKPNLFQDLLISLKWNALKEKLFNLTIKKSGEINQPITEDISAALSNILNDPEFCKDALDFAQNEKYGPLVELLKNSLADVIPGRIELQCEIESTDVKSKSEDEEESKSEPQTETKQNAEKQKNKLYNLNDFIEVACVEDKIIGKTLSKLKKDDGVVVKVIDPKYSEHQISRLDSYRYGLCYCGFIEFYKEDEENEYAIFKLSANTFGRMKLNKYSKNAKIKTIIDDNEPANAGYKFIFENTLTFYLILIASAFILSFLAWQYYFVWMD